ncbi:hypothetical protein Micbo1qcDRAFT_40468 [Microdochium bolleyi]|uniref:Uncharacterized protein n=1 Tax=Microdochium bolleyi TaxID=196109 RepID=A0A136J9X3_9PEZI|nr:hypothetical protein Micbo1qcDRAFT_40468 [Microdochium bolleyi]
MPRLKRASISAWLPAPEVDGREGVISNGRRLWNVWYVTRGIDADDSRGSRLFWFQNPEFFDHVDKTRVIWDTPGWRPSEKLRELFGMIGRKSRGDDCKEIFVSPEHI